MKRRRFGWNLLQCVIGVVVLVPSFAAGEDGLIGHWLFDRSHILGQGLPDVAGRSLTTITGPVHVEQSGTWQSLRLDDSVVIHLNEHKTVRVPTRSLTAEAWVRIDKPSPWGGIVGAIHDNGNDEKGWLLGFQEKKFMFAVKGKEGSPQLTYLKAPEPFERRRWYHVVGTYDGTEQRLYIDGKLAASTREQRGDILYPSNSFYHIGAYRDGDEFYRTVGALNEIRVYERALSPEAIEKQYRAKVSSCPDPLTLRLPSIFSNNMVVQRGRSIPVWGWAKKGEEIRVTLGTDVATTEADSKGTWTLTLPPQKSAMPLKLTVSGRTDKLVIEDILVGEVWVCSGQSNMQWPLRASGHAQHMINAANFPKMRLFTVKNVMESEPSGEVEGTWDVCRPETAAGFSAVAYHFGRELHQELNVPVGLINSSWGGSLCEAWMSREALHTDPSFAEILEQARSNSWLGEGLYNGMIRPLIPFAIRGAIWYQGEANAPRADQYRKLFPTLIRDWREQWGQGNFPFYFVQLCPFKTDPIPWAELWDAQRRALSEPNTGMVVTTDIGELRNIHPRNKQEVGRRLALWALSETYGRKGTIYSGPLYKSMHIAGNTIKLRFEHSEGLASRDGQPLNWFVIAGRDQVFEPAQATIEGDTLVVQSDRVPLPVAVRFAWSAVAQPNLINKSGLPASPFRTDDWQLVTSATPKK